MTDYISREKDKYIKLSQALEALDSCSCWWAHDRMEAIPAADVREVKRGKWSVQEIYKHEMSYGTTAYEPVYKCSACGNLMESYLRYDAPIMPEDADFPHFCPNCGADMREES